MTIAAGFVCSDGLVLFADTEEQQGYTKTNVEKIRQSSSGGIALAIANAGNGYLADALIDRIFDEVEGKRVHQATIVGIIRNTIIEFHRDEVALYPSSDDVKNIGLVIGLQLNQDKPLLLHSDATALRKVTEFTVIGYGVEIKFMAQQLYQKDMPVKHGVLIANHLCKTAKDHVQGCGGHSRIATVSDGNIEIRHFFDVWDDERVFSSLSANYRAVLLSIPDEDIADVQFHNCLEWFVDQAWEMRSEILSSKEFSQKTKEQMKTYKHPPGITRYYGTLERRGFLGTDRRGPFLPKLLPSQKLEKEK